MESILTEVLDDKERRDGRGRRIVAKERQEELLRAYDSSDLSQREFARREGINFHTFVGVVAAPTARARNGTAAPIPRTEFTVHAEGEQHGGESGKRPAGDLLGGRKRSG